MKLESRSCTLCGPGAEKRTLFPATFNESDLNGAIFSARRAPDLRHFKLVECAGCGMVYSDPACDPAELASLYQASSVTYQDQEAQIFDSYAPILTRALPRLERRGVFLEIGGGRGFMLRYGHDNGFASQVEIEPSADAEARFAPPSPDARFVRGVFREGSVPSNSVSLACFFQMLDHVPNPGGFLASVHDALEPGGTAVCVTHNTRALSARLLGERSPIYDIEHTYLFHPGNLSALFAKAGFRDIEAFPVSNRYSVRYWLNLAPIPASARSVLLSLMGPTGFADMRLGLRAGNFAVIASKPRGRA